ncbi:hypothetical protein LTS17_011542 [Exophiala oligosperma]
MPAGQRLDAEGVIKALCEMMATATEFQVDVAAMQAHFGVQVDRTIHRKIDNLIEPYGYRFRRGQVEKVPEPVEDEDDDDDEDEDMEDDDDEDDDDDDDDGDVAEAQGGVEEQAGGGATNEDVDEDMGGASDDAAAAAEEETGAVSIKIEE